MKLRSFFGSKGLSSIMAAVLMTVLIMLSMNAFLAVVSHSDLYTMSSQERNMREWERKSEHLRIVSLSIDGGKLNATVINEGAEPIELADIWITEPAVNTHKVYNFTKPYNLPISPASYKTNIGQNLSGFKPQPPTLSSSSTYEVKINTLRGNSAEWTYIPQASQAKIGPFYFSFDKQSFNYTTYNPTGSGAAWEIVCSSTNHKHNTIFWLKFTNHGTRDIEISYLSYIMVVKPYSDYLEDEFYYHILDPRSTSQTPVAYVDYSQIVPANLENPEEGVTQIVKFGATKPGISTLQDFPVPDATSYPNERMYVYTVWIGIFWRWSGSSDYYGIYLPFTGIHVRSS